MSPVTSAPARRKDSLGRVLLFDDDRRSTPAFTNLLACAGFDAVGCCDPGAAETLALEGRFDACLIDIVTPSGPLGHDLIARLRKHPRTAGLSILAMSGFGGEYLEKALRLGADAAIEKNDINGRIVPLLARLCREARAAASEDGPRVLIVEDDETLAGLAESVLRDALTGPISFVTAPTVRRAQSAIRRRMPSLILLDLHLAGGGDGLEFLRALKADPKTASVPVIVMTGSEPDQAMRECFEAGALDYVSKPLRSGELAARARKALGDGPLTWGPLRLDRAAREVRLAGRPLEVGAKEFSILHSLVKAAGATVLADKLLRDVWGVPEGSALPAHYRTLLVHVSNLRRKLGPHRRLIGNIRGVGYRVAPPKA